MTRYAWPSWPRIEPLAAVRSQHDYRVVDLQVEHVRPFHRPAYCLTRDGARDGRAMEPLRHRLAISPDKRKTLALQGFFGGSGGGI